MTGVPSPQGPVAGDEVYREEHVTPGEASGPMRRVGIGLISLFQGGGEGGNCAALFTVPALFALDSAPVIQRVRGVR